MHDALSVSKVNRARAPREQRDDFRTATRGPGSSRFDAMIKSESQISRLESVRQATTFDQLHAEEMLAVKFSSLVNRDDVRMSESGSGFGFGTKALNLRIARPTPGKNDL